MRRSRPRGHAEAEAWNANVKKASDDRQRGKIAKTRPVARGKPLGNAPREADAVATEKTSEGDIEGKRNRLKRTVLKIKRGNQIGAKTDTEGGQEEDTVVGPCGKGRGGCSTNRQSWNFKRRERAAKAWPDDDFRPQKDEPGNTIGGLPAREQKKRRLI